MEDSPLVFDTLNEAISYCFKMEQSNLLTLDRISEILSLPHLWLKLRNDSPVPCSTVSRRRVSSILSSSDLFVRSGPPRSCLWALRPARSPFVSDAAVISAVEQMLTSHGPLTINEIAWSSDLDGADVQTFARFLADHPERFTPGPDATYWFTNEKRPVRANYASMVHALMCACAEFPAGATIEELYRLLCMSTVGGTKQIERRKVSRELSRRSDLFGRVGRAKYICRRLDQPPTLLRERPDEYGDPPTVQRCEEEFDPFAFFGNGFQFAIE
jgi:hypothetical protein